MDVYTYRPFKTQTLAGQFAFNDLTPPLPFEVVDIIFKQLSIFEVLPLVGVARQWRVFSKGNLLEVTALRQDPLLTTAMLKTLFSTTTLNSFINEACSMELIRFLNLSAGKSEASLMTYMRNMRSGSAEDFPKLKNYIAGSTSPFIITADEALSLNHDACGYQAAFKLTIEAQTYLDSSRSMTAFCDIVSECVEGKEQGHCHKAAMRSMHTAPATIGRAIAAGICAKAELIIACNQTLLSTSVSDIRALEHVCFYANHWGLISAKMASFAPAHTSIIYIKTKTSKLPTTPSHAYLQCTVFHGCPSSSFLSIIREYVVQMSFTLFLRNLSPDAPLAVKVKRKIL